MKKRLMANMKDEEEQDENKIESIDASIQNNKNQNTELDRELSSPVPILKANNNQQYSLNVSDPSFSPSVQTKQSLIVPLSALGDNNQNDAYQNGYSSSVYQPTLTQRQPSYGYDFNRPLSPDEKLDQMLNEQLKRSLSPDLNNNYTPYDQKNSSYGSPKAQYGNVKPKKINIAQELSDERNFNCVPSQYTNDYPQINKSTYSQPATTINYNQSPRQWSASNTTPLNPATTTSYSIPIEIHNSRPQYYSNPQLNFQSTPAATSTNYERPQSQQSLSNSTTYQIPIINQNGNQPRTTAQPPQPPQRQQSLRSFQNEKEIPVQYEEPIQSRSFKILQKLTADIEDEIDKLNVFDQQNKEAYHRDPLEGEFYCWMNFSLSVII